MYENIGTTSVLPFIFIFIYRSVSCFQLPYPTLGVIISNFPSKMLLTFEFPFVVVFIISIVPLLNAKNKPTLNFPVRLVVTVSIRYSYFCLPLPLGTHIFLFACVCNYLYTTIRFNSRKGITFSFS